jgi:hypothetical protein
LSLEPVASRVQQNIDNARILKNVDNAGLLVFPLLLVCLKCGFPRFTTQETELALLGMCSLISEVSNLKVVA